MDPVTFTTLGPQAQQSVSAWLVGAPGHGRSGGSSASASSGTGGWQVVTRTRQKSATIWLDYFPLVQTMTCILDGRANITGPRQLSNTQSVEPLMAILESFEEPAPGTSPPSPPIIGLSGPVRHTDLYWVCSKLDFPSGEDDVEIRDDSTGLITQRNFTIELTEYVPTDVINVGITPAQAAVLNAGTSSGLGTVSPSGQTYTVAAGDTLQGIAAKVYANTSYWADIAILNNIPYGAILQPGQVLQLPAK
jgi:LysM repeat protein